MGHEIHFGHWLIVIRDFLKTEFISFFSRLPRNVMHDEYFPVSRFKQTDLLSLFFSFLSQQHRRLRSSSERAMRDFGEV